MPVQVVEDFIKASADGSDPGLPSNLGEQLRAARELFGACLAETVLRTDHEPTHRALEAFSNALARCCVASGEHVVEQKLASIQFMLELGPVLARHAGESIAALPPIARGFALQASIKALQEAALAQPAEAA